MFIKNEHEFKLQQLHITFQRGFVSQFISSLVQVLVEVIPILVKQNTIMSFISYIM
jgi:hypothetical protein